MSLNLSKLEKVRHLGNGGVEARCPACAEGGHDRKGEHLFIKPDGRFGCCANPKDREHRKRIFALAGDTAPRSIKVKSPAVKVASPAVMLGVLGRLGRVFASRAKPDSGPDASDGVSEVRSEPDAVRTARTGETESIQEEPQESRTLRTPFLFLSVRENEKERDENTSNLKDCAGGVRSVRDVPLQTELNEGVRAVRQQEQRMPYLTPGGVLVIPFDSPERFQWWKGGQSVAETRAEVERGFPDAERKESNATRV